MDFKQIFNISIVISLLITGFFWIDSIPYASDFAFNEINIIQDPVQNSSNAKPFEHRTKKEVYFIKPIANYKISGKVVAKNLLFDGENKALGPIDIGLIWGEIAPEYRKHSWFKSSQRWLTFNVKKGSPYSIEYLKDHSSHNHIIPANKNIKNAVKSLSKNQNVMLKGYLVSVNHNGRNIWKSSLTRKDLSAHSCEVMYVYEVQIGDKIYK